jgi:mono/diheme cytochrome c family protein
MGPSRILTFLLLAVSMASAVHAAAPAAGPSGKEVWSENCMLCHGEKGQPSEAGKRVGAADLSAPAWQASRTDDQIKNIVTNGPGKPNTMMRAFRDELSAEEIDAVVKYIRTLAAKPATKKK